MNEEGEPDLVWADGCPCGESHLVRPAIADNITKLGATVMVTVPLIGAWIIPRVYIAGHRVVWAHVEALAAQYGWEKVG